MAFVGRTLEPWDFVEQRFNTAAGYGMWYEHLCGERPTSAHLAIVRAWLKTARFGDVIYLNEDGESTKEYADLEIRWATDMPLPHPPIKTEH